MEGPRDLTVAVNVRDGVRHVQAWAQALAAQTVQGFRVLVLDDGSTDGTPEALEDALAELPGDVEVLRRPARGLQPARRELFETVATPLVLLVDIDILLAPEAVGRYLDAIRPDDVAAVCCRTRNRAPQLPAQAHDAVRQLLYRRRADRAGNAQWLEGSPTMWRTEVLRALGGSSDAAVSEDLDISFRARRAGWRLVLLDAPLATHPDPATWRELWRRERHTGEREGRMAAAGERQVLRGLRAVRVAPLAGPAYVLVVLASLPLLVLLPHHRLAGWWAFHWMQFAYARGFARGHREQRRRG